MGVADRELKKAYLDNVAYLSVSQKNGPVYSFRFIYISGPACWFCFGEAILLHQEASRTGKRSRSMIRGHHEQSPPAQSLQTSSHEADRFDDPAGGDARRGYLRARR